MVKVIICLYNKFNMDSIFEFFKINDYNEEEEPKVTIKKDEKYF